MTTGEPRRSRPRVEPVFLWAGGVIVLVVVAVVALRGALATPSAVVPPAEAALAADSGVEGIDVRVDTVASSRIAVLERRVARDSTDHAALVELGHAYLADGQIDRATVVNFKAVQLRPSAPETAEAFAHLGMILAYQGEDTVGLQSIDQALLLRPDLPEALLYRGMITFSQADYPAAINAWTRYLERAPADADTTHIRALIEAAQQMLTPPLPQASGRVFN